MGNFYTNVTLSDVDPAAVEAWLVGDGRQAFVGTWGRHTVVYDSAGEIQDGSHAQLAERLSAVFGCAALAALNHDDDVLVLDLYVDGASRGEFNSLPEFFADDGEEAAMWSGGLDVAALIAVYGD